MPLAEVKLSCGRFYLNVGDVIVAMQGDRCRDSEMPEEVLPPIPTEELERTYIGDKCAKDLPIELVRFFRGDAWTEQMLKWAAKKINQAAGNE